MRGVVISPPCPASGGRILGPDPQREFWYQSFHRLALSERLLDGNRARRPHLPRALLDALVRAPTTCPSPRQLDRLADAYARPGAFVRSINWYRSGSAAVARALAEQTPDPADRIAPPTTHAVARARPAVPARLVGQGRRLVRRADLRFVDGVGHFVPLEAPEVFAAAIREH